MKQTLLYPKLGHSMRRSFYCSCGLLYLLLTFATPLAATAQYKLIWQTPPFGEDIGAFQRVIASETDQEGNLLLLAESRHDAFDNRMVLYKYSGDGQLLWQVYPQQNNSAWYERPIKLRLDSSGNSYVLSNLEENHESVGALVSKISAGGKSVWSRGFTSDNYPFERCTDMVVSDAQEVAVAGIGADGHGIVKMLYPTGKTAWSRKVAATMTALDFTPAGDIVGVGAISSYSSNLSSAYVTTLQHATGQTMMEHTYDYQLQARNTYDEPVRVHVTAAGDIFVLSNISFDPYNFNLMLMRTSSDGTEKWHTLVGNTDESLALDVAYSEQDEVVVLGLERKYRETSDYFLTKIEGDGSKPWYRTFNRYDGKEINEMAPADVDIDKDGNIALTAHSAIFDAPPAFFVPPVYKQEPVLVSILYDAAGEQVWETKYDISEETRTYGRSISFDNMGNLFVTASVTPAEEHPSYEHLVLYKFGMAPGCATPVAVKLYLPPHAMRTGEQVRTTADFGNYEFTEDKGIRWTWGDGSNPTVSYTAFGTARITGEHTYRQAGIYNIGLNFDESCLKAANEGFEQQMVIYNPMAGAVTGAGQLTHEAAGLPYVHGTRPTTFAFAVRYPNAKADKPVGTTVLLLNNQNRFFSTAYDWLVVSHNRAAWHGKGTLDGKAGYQFLITVEDGGMAGINDPGDKMRVQIWNSSSHLVYDSQSSHPQMADLHQPLQHIKQGQVLILTKEQRLLASGAADLKAADDIEPGVIAYPNPFQSRAVVTFAAMQPGSYHAALYDMKGALVRELRSGTAAAGEIITLEVDGAELPNGVYFTKISTSDDVKTVKLLLQR